jgi:hypothetical protein
MNEPIHAYVRIDIDPEADLAEWEETTRNLRRDFLELDVADASFLSAPPPYGAKGDAVTWGTLVLTLASGGVLQTVVGKLIDWISHRESRSVTLEIDGDKLQLEKLSKPEQHQLIDAFLARHKKSPHS